MSQLDVDHYSGNIIDQIEALKRRVDDLERKRIYRFGDVTGDDYAEFEADGTLEFNGEATVWDDLQVNISSVRLPAANSPTWTAYKGSQVLAFDGASTDTIYFAAQLPHSYKAGSDIEFHIHYVPEDNTAGNVRWVFTHSWADISEAHPGETTVTTILATPEVTDQHTLGEIEDAITGTGYTISSVLLCSLARTGGHVDDTYNAKNIYVTALDFHFEKDTVGSREELSK